MKGLSKATMIIAKILEIIFWIMAAAMLVLLTWSLFASPETIAAAADDIAMDSDLAVRGITVIDAAGGLPLTRGGLAAFSVFGALLTGLIGMVLRNVYLIIKTSRGETKLSRGATPFQPENVRMLRQIGVFTIAIPILELFFSILVQLIFGAEYVEAHLDLSHVFLGILVLWLTQVFAYGAELQAESDGLI